MDNSRFGIIWNLARGTVPHIRKICIGTRVITGTPPIETLYYNEAREALNPKP